MIISSQLQHLIANADKYSYRQHIIRRLYKMQKFLQSANNLMLETLCCNHNFVVKILQTTFVNASYSEQCTVQIRFS